MIDAGNILNESNYADNSAILLVNVAAPYALSVLVNGSTIAGANSSFNILPSVLSSSRCSASNSLYAPQTQSFMLQCVNTSNGQTVAGCQYSAQIASGPFDGGHTHGDGDSSRPLACLPGECPTVINLLTQGQSGTIGTLGNSFTYASPEISGELVVNFTGSDPNGNPISSQNLPPQLVFQVQASGSPSWVPLSNDNVSVIINGADNSPSHPTGYYGTTEMAEAVDLLGQNFVETLSDSETPPKIRSQAASLPWGGLYDIGKDWDTPHCGHRDGMTIDLSLSNLDANAKSVLADAAQDSRLGFFYIPESPSNLTANHWHATLVQSSKSQ